MPERRGRVGQSLSMVLMLVVMAALAIGLGVLMGRYAFGLLASGPGPGNGKAPQATSEVAPAGVSGDAASTSPSRPGAPVPETTSPGAEGVATTAPCPADESAQVPRATTGQILYRVQVGEFDDRTGAESLARELAGAGYPGFVTGGVPYRVQVGAFAEKANAERLAAELEAKGYSVVVVQ
ncbi:MAG: SPOR domain-containing protein [Bacillota bacterium]|nr:SPOR domain-containing protein [Bacillota bacterium]